MGAQQSTFEEGGSEGAPSIVEVFIQPVLAKANHFGSCNTSRKSFWKICKYCFV